MKVLEVSDFSWLYHVAGHPNDDGNVLVGANTLIHLLNEHAQMKQHLAAVNAASAESVFRSDKDMLTESTLATYSSTFASFSRYMWEAWGIAFNDTDAMENPNVWRDIAAVHVAGFTEWMSGKGYARATVAYRTSIIKRIVKLAYTVGVISPDTIRAILDGDAQQLSTDNQLL